jgi:pimeloyl-ACP methyl ester carboxylesterase
MTLQSCEASYGEEGFTYYLGPRPSGRSRGLLVIVHGRSRSPLGLVEAFAGPARERGFTVLAPVFDEEAYGRVRRLRGTGWFTMPDPHVAFPFGCAPSIDLPAGVPDLKGFLELPTRVMVGERDVERDGQLRASPFLDGTQGIHRLERARRWVDAVSRAADDHGLEGSVSLEILPDSGHSTREAICKGGLVERTLSFLTSSDS